MFSASGYRSPWSRRFLRTGARMAMLPLITVKLGQLYAREAFASEVVNKARGTKWNQHGSQGNVETIVALLDGDVENARAALATEADFNRAIAIYLTRHPRPALKIVEERKFQARLGQIQTLSYTRRHVAYVLRCWSVHYTWRQSIHTPSETFSHQQQQQTATTTSSSGSRRCIRTKSRSARNELSQQQQHLQHS